MPSGFPRLPIVLLLIAASVSSSSCVTAYGKARREARAAETAGNERNALFAHRKICELRGPSHQSCRRVEELSASLAEQAVARAERVCMDGRVEDCDMLLRQSAGPAFNHPLIAALIEHSMKAAVVFDEIAMKAVDACVPVESPSPEASLAALACAAAERRPPLDRRAFDERLDEHRELLASPFIDLLTEASFGGAYSLAVIAGCIEASHGSRALSEQSWEAFLRASSRPLELRLIWEGLGPVPSHYDAFCDQLHEKLTGVYCSFDGDPGALRMILTVHEGDIEYAFRDEPFTVRYQSGYRIESNPEREAADRRVALAEYALSDSEPIYRDWDAACESAKRALRQAGHCHDCPEREARRYNCDRADTAKSTYDRHERELQRARSAQNRTPATLEIPEYALHQYIERHHYWTVDYRIEAGPEEQPDAATVSDRIVRSSIDRPAFEPAGITRSVSEAPDPEVFSAAIAGRAISLVLQAAYDVRADAAPDPEDLCRSEDLLEWLDCRAEAALAAGRAVTAAELMAGLWRRFNIEGTPPACR